MRTRELYLHIGMHKTGSSSIQKSFFSGISDELFYIHYEKPNSSALILRLFKENYENFPTLKNVKASFMLMSKKDVFNRVETIIDESVCDRFLLSAEALTHLKQNEVLELQKWLSSMFDHIYVVGYVRDPVSFMESAFQQRLKGGLSSLNPTTLFPQYQKKFEKFINVFGKDNVLLWNFNPKSFPLNCVVRDFCQKINVQIDDKAESIPRANSSLSLNAIKVLFIYNKFSKAKLEKKNRRKLLKFVKKINGGKLHFSQKLLERVSSKINSDVAWVNNLLTVPVSIKVTNDNNVISSESELIAIDKELVNELSLHGIELNLQSVTPDLLVQELDKKLFDH